MGDIVCVIIWWPKPTSCDIVGGKAKQINNIKKSGGAPDSENQPNTTVDIPIDIIERVAECLQDDLPTLGKLEASTKRFSANWNNLDTINAIQQMIPSGLKIHIGYTEGFNINALSTLSQNTQSVLNEYSFTKQNAHLLHIRVSGTTDTTIKRVWVQKMKGLIQKFISAKKAFDIVAGVMSPTIAIEPNSIPQTTELAWGDITYINTSKCIQTLEDSGNEVLVAAIREGSEKYKQSINSITYTGQRVDTAPSAQPNAGGGSLTQKILVRKEHIDGRMRNVYRIKGQGNKLFISKKGKLVRLLRK